MVYRKRRQILNVGLCGKPVLETEKWSRTPGLGRDGTQAGNHFSGLGDKYLTW